MLDAFLAIFLADLTIRVNIHGIVMDTEMDIIDGNTIIFTLFDSLHFRNQQVRSRLHHIFTRTQEKGLFRHSSIDVISFLNKTSEPTESGRCAQPMLLFLTTRSLFLEAHLMSPRRNLEH